MPGVQPGNVSVSTPNGSPFNYFAAVSPFGELHVTMDPVELFQDSFDATGVDTANRWTSGGTVPPTQPAGGNVLVNPATAASASSSLVSQPALSLSSTMVFAAIVALEAGTVAKGNHRFWGFGTPPGTWTALLPLQDAVGFEVDTAGVLRASVYSAGVRVFTQVMTAPTDGNPHLYYLLGRPSAFFFFLDGTEIPISPIPAQAVPSIQTLPVRLHSINGLATTTGTPTMTVVSTGVVDHARGATRIADGAFPWRRAQVSTSGALAVREGAASAVQAPTQWAVLATAVTSVVTADPTRTVLVFNSASTSSVFIRYDTSAPTVNPGGYHDVIAPNVRFPVPKELAGAAISMIGSAANGAINIATATAA